MARPAISVVLADDHPAFLIGLRKALTDRPAVEVVGEAHDGRAALQAITALRPQVAIVDLELPLLPGLRLIEAIQRERIRTRVIVLSAYQDSARVHRAVAAGARAYLAKTSPPELVAAAVEQVHAGATVLPPEAQTALAAHIRARERGGDVLDARERTVLMHAADGLTVDEISLQTALSPSSVKAAMQAVFEKLEVDDRAAAVAQAIRHGLI